MKALHDLLGKLEPLAKKSAFTYTLYDAAHTFFFKPDHVTHGGVHIRDGMDLKRTMFHVVIALQLCLLHGMINIGHQHYLAFGMFEGLTDGIIPKVVYGLIQLLPIVIIVHVVGLGIEILFAAKKGHAVEEGFLVSGILIPLIMPPDIPLWMVAVATAFAVVVAKEAFGGTGMNILNVALTARVFIFFAYPGQISGDTVWVAYDYNWIHELFPNLLHIADTQQIVDGFSGATPLALGALGGWDAITAQYSVSDMFFGFIPGSIGEMSKIAIIIGIGMLIALGIGSWRIMVSMLIGGLVMGLLLNMFGTDPFSQVPAHYHLIMGSFLFGLAYMATDPVTAAGTDTGKWIYGFFAGFFAILVRVLNPAYPEGVMLAILLMNVFAPLIDHFVIQANIKRRLSRVG